MTIFLLYNPFMTLKYICVYVHTYVYSVCVCRYEDMVWDLVLSFYHVDSGAQAVVIKFGEKCLYPQNCLTYFFLRYFAVFG